MNQLITTDIEMTSLDIAEVTGKLHKHVLADIRKEIEELGDEIGQPIFRPSSYINSQNKEQPCYEFGKDGAMQLALKYDAKTRYRVIKRIEELESEIKPQSQLEILQGSINQLVEQERRMNEQDKRIETVERKQEEIKDVMSITTHNWRDDVKRIVNTIARDNGGSYRQTWQRTYTDLEIRGGCDLKRRLNNMKERAKEAGATKREVKNINNLDVIERDQKLTEIYLTIIKEMAVKHGVDTP